MLSDWYRCGWPSMPDIPFEEPAGCSGESRFFPFPTWKEKHVEAENQLCATALLSLRLVPV